MAWRDNKEFVAVARKRWRKDMGKCVDSDAGASQRMARRFEGWIAARVEAGASPKDLYAPDVQSSDCGSIAQWLRNFADDHWDMDTTAKLRHAADMLTTHTESGSVAYADDYGELASALEETAEKLRALDKLHRNAGDAKAFSQLEGVANELVNDGKGNLAEHIWSALDKIRAVRNTECRSVSPSLVEDAWAVATWLEARLMEEYAGLTDEKDARLGDDEEHQACRRLIEAFSPDTRVTEQESASNQEKIGVE